MSLLHINNFATISGYSVSNGTFASSTDYHYNAATSGLLTVGASGHLSAYKATAIGSTINGSIAGSWFRVVYYLPLDITGGSAMYVNFLSGGAGLAYGAVQWSSIERAAGWHVLEGRIPTAASFGAYDAASLTGYGFEVIAPQGTVVYIGSIEIYQPAAELPTFVLTFDDAPSDVSSFVAPLLEGYGWRGTFAAVRSLAGGPGYATVAQLQAMDAAGHLIVNHTDAHTAWVALTDAQREDELLKGRQFLLNNGLWRGADILVWPYGFQGNQTTMDMCYRHCRCCINTTWLFPELVLTGSGQAYPHYQPMHRRHYFNRVMQNNGFTTAGIDAAITTKQISVVMSHVIDGTGANHSQGAFTTVCDYLKAKEDAGLCRVTSLLDVLNGAEARANRAGIYTGTVIDGVPGTATTAAAQLAADQAAGQFGKRGNISIGL